MKTELNETVINYMANKSKQEKEIIIELIRNDKEIKKIYNKLNSLETLFGFKSEMSVGL